MPITERIVLEKKLRSGKRRRMTQFENFFVIARGQDPLRMRERRSLARDKKHQKIEHLKLEYRMCSNEYLIIKGRGKRRGLVKANIAGTRPNV